MIIGYSESTLWQNIAKQQDSIRDEADWLKLYISTQELDCMEDCVRNIMDSCTAIMENLEHLKGEKL